MPGTDRARKLRGRRLAAFLERALAEAGAADAGRLAAALSRRLSQARARDRVGGALERHQRPVVPPAAAATLASPAGGAAPRTVSDGAGADRFDPRAYSLVAALARDGADALLARLEAIHSADDLRLLARTQHIPLEGEAGSLPELRRAIVRGAERRLADRRAAAG